LAIKTLNRTPFRILKAHRRRIFLPRDDYGSIAQAGIIPLLDRGIEGVHVDVNDLPECWCFAHRGVIRLLFA
jgi:hypothetical protein